MNDLKIRRAVHSRLIRHYHTSRNALVIDELGIHHGRARIDIAVINGNLTGYEIKSELDDLSRLQSQSEAYNLVFNKLTLIAADKFLNDAFDLLPKWWGIVAVNRGVRGGVILDKLRMPEQNPRTDAYSIVKLLWKEEALELLKGIGFDGKFLRAKREDLYGILVDTISRDVLQETVCNTLKKRQNWRHHAQLS